MVNTRLCEQRAKKADMMNGGKCLITYSWSCPRYQCNSSTYHLCKHLSLSFQISSLGYLSRKVQNIKEAKIRFTKVGENAVVTGKLFTDCIERGGAGVDISLHGFFSQQNVPQEHHRLSTHSPLGLSHNVGLEKGAIRTFLSVIRRSRSSD